MHYDILINNNNRYVNLVFVGKVNTIPRMALELKQVKTVKKTRVLTIKEYAYITNNSKTHLKRKLIFLIKRTHH